MDSPNSKISCKATFTTNSIPITKPGLHGSYEIPLGFILSPMANLPSSSHFLTEKDMYMCIKCLSYFNMYCRIVENGTKWICPICDQVNALEPTMSKNMQMMKSEVVEYHQKAATTNTENSNDNSYHHCKNVTILVIDGNLPPNEIRSILSNLSSRFSAKDDKNSKNPRGTNDDDQEKQMIGLIIYTSIISIYQIGVQGIASADIYSIRNSSTYIDSYEDDYHDHDGFLNDDYPHDNNHVFDEMFPDLENDRMYLGSSWDQVKFCANMYFGLDGNMGEQNSANSTNIDGAAQNSNANNCNFEKRSDINYHIDKKQPLSRRDMLRLKREERMKKKMENDASKKSADGYHLDNCTPAQAAEWLQQHLQNTTSRRANRNNGTLRNKRRCTGEAAAYGIALASSIEDRYNARVLLFTNGCPNTGRGGVTLSQNESSYNKHKNMDNDLMIDATKIEYSSRYFNAIGKEAFDDGIAIDIFCSGNNTTLGAQALFSLVKPSAGYVLSHTSFEAETFQKNLEYVLSSTQMSWTKNQDIDSVRLGMACSNWRNVINGCLVDLRMPRYMIPTSFNGPGEMVETQKKHTLSNEHEVFLSCSKFAADQGIPTNNIPSIEALESTRIRFRIGRFDSRSTFTVMMQVKDTSHIPAHPNGNHFFYFQFITRYLNPDDITDLVTRVVSQRVPVSTRDTNFNEHNDFFNSLNEKVLPVVLAKEAAYRCMVKKKDQTGGKRSSTVSHEDVENLVPRAQYDLDTTVNRIANAYFDVNNNYSSQLPNDSEESQNDAKSGDPPELRIALKLLHHFRRGTILGSSMQSIDDRSLSRDIFLRMSLNDSLAIMAPMVWMRRRDADGTVSSMEVPAETLILWDDCIIAADNFDSMFVWSGRETLDSSYDVLRKDCMDFLLERSKDRFPAPTLYSLKEGESMARRFSSRLVPSHGDKEDDQIKNFPALQILSEDYLRRLRSKYRIYDPQSDDTFLHWFAKISNTNSSKWQQASSLCE